MKLRRFDSEMWIPRPVKEVFAFFEEPRNLSLITPPSMRMRMLPPAASRVRKGSLFHYTMRVRGVPVWWGTRIAQYDAPHRFVDRQLWGPYLKWNHTHLFTEENGGTRVRDHIEYAHIGGSRVDRWLVRPDLERIFAYRREQLATIFG